MQIPNRLENTVGGAVSCPICGKVYNCIIATHVCELSIPEDLRELAATIRQDAEQRSRDRDAIEAHKQRIAELEASNARLVAALLRRGLSKSPCDICGYNGPGYYNATNHQCVAEMFALAQAK